MAFVYGITVRNLTSGISLHNVHPTRGGHQVTQAVHLAMIYHVHI